MGLEPVWWAYEPSAAFRALALQLRQSNDARTLAGLTPPWPWPRPQSLLGDGPFQGLPPTACGEGTWKTLCTC